LSMNFFPSKIFSLAFRLFLNALSVK